MQSHRLILIVLAALSATNDVGATGTFSVVVNQKNPVSSLTASDLKRLTSGGTKAWDGGVVVQLGIIPGEAPETQYLASTLGTTPRELMSLIQQQVFKGELRRPVVLRSSPDCGALAAANPGGVCIAATGTPMPPGTKIVPVR